MFTHKMAEDLQRQHKQHKALSANETSQPKDGHTEGDLIGGRGKKKGRPPKGIGTMNPVSASSLSGSSTSSKTVAAILKQQHEGLKIAEEGSHVLQRQHHQLQQQQYKSQKHKVAPSQTSTSYGKTGNSPLGRGGSPSVVISPALSPSNARVMSPQTKDHNHPVTTKSSSLSRDISPSRITAQIVKVMADTSSSSAAPNLLRSALQGNMPDPMGILSASKGEGGLVSAVTPNPNPGSTGVQTSNRKSPANLRSLSPSGSSVSGPQKQTTFSNMLTSKTGGGTLFLNQQEDSSSDLQTGGASPSVVTQIPVTVASLLAAPPGSLQTVNVSHTPKCTSSTGQASGVSTASTNIAALLSTTSRPSPRSAMEVAQQIKMEANGQSASAQRAALRPGMQQQLRTQIQGSKSIDAQLAPKQAPTSFQSGQQRLSPKELDQNQKQALDNSMSLLASKLASSPAVSMTIHPGTSTASAKQQNQLDMNSLLLLSSSAPSSSLSPSSSSSSAVRNVGQQPSPSLKSSTEQRQRLTASQLLKHQQQQQQQHTSQVVFGSSKQPVAQAQKQSVSADQAWHPQQQQPPAQAGATGFGETLYTQEKQQVIGRLIQAKIGAMPEQASPVDSSGKSGIPSQSSSLVSKHLRGSSQTSLRSGTDSAVITSLGIQVSVNSSMLSSGGTVAVNKAYMVQNSTGLVSSSLPNVVKTGPGDSKQTAIDVDLDLGQQRSSASDFGGSLKNIAAPNVVISKPQSSNMKSVNHNTNKAFHTVLGHQLINSTGSSLSGLKDFTVSSSSSSSSSLTNSSRDSQAFQPVQSVKASSLSSSSSSSIHPTASYLAHIPKPIMHASTSSVSSLSSSTTGVPSTEYTPPPPYPSKPLQQLSSRSNQASRQLAHNPFTFPTSGVRVRTDHNSHGLLSYSGTLFPSSEAENAELGESKHSMKQELEEAGSRESKYSTGLVKAQSDLAAVRVQTTLGSLTRTTTGEMPRLVPELGKVKVETTPPESSVFNHIGEELEHKSVEQPFNQRMANLSCFPVMNTTYRAAYRSHAVAVQRARSGVVTNTAKSLDILRQNLQRSINKEITEIIRKYTEKYFTPALENIRKNNNDGLIGNEHINYVCRAILEEAKSEYMSNSGRRSVTPTTDMTDNLSETGSVNGRRQHYLKRSRVSDSDSEKGSDGGFKRKAAKRKGRPPVHGSGRVTPSKPGKSGEPVKREGPKWDPERLKTDTQFVMGARANKALGLGNTRGRLYIRHPDVFKYIGDQEDKVWLYEHNLMPATGGKAYMLVLEDIEDLSRSDEYRDSPGLMMHECIGFTVPEWMLKKMKEQMNALRSDLHKSSSHSPVGDVGKGETKVLPFSSFASPLMKEEAQPSPADAEEIEFLSTTNDEDTQPSSAVSPFTVTGGFDDGPSPSPSDMDTMDEQNVVNSIFS